MISNLRARLGFWVLLSFLIFTFSSVLLAQGKPKAKSKDQKPAATTPAPATGPSAAEDPDKTFNSAVAGLKFREIGPATMGGRIDDIEVVPGDPRTIYVATPAAGILKSTNGGTSWSVIFDKESVPGVGDIAISPSSPDIIWAGSGEANNRQSSRGEMEFTNRTTPERPGRIWASPAQCTLRGSSFTRQILISSGSLLKVTCGDRAAERGVYKTTDGGRTWQQV